MFQIKNIATHDFQNGNTTLDGAAQTDCEFKHLCEIYLQSFMFQIKRDQKYCDSQLSNGNTWIVRLQINFTRYVCESTNIYNSFPKSV